MSELFGLAVEKVQTSSFGGYPHVSFFIFHHVSHKRIAEAVVAGDIGRIKGKQVSFRIEIVYASIIGSQPYTSLAVFINGEYGRMADTSRPVIVSIYSEFFVMWIIFVQSLKGAYPYIAIIIFCKVTHLVACQLIGALGNVADWIIYGAIADRRVEEVFHIAVGSTHEHTIHTSGNPYIPF